MIKPHAPEMKGNSGEAHHDGRPDASHEEEVRKANKGGDDTTSGEEKAGFDE